MIKDNIIYNISSHTLENKKQLKWRRNLLRITKLTKTKAVSTNNKNIKGLRTKFEN